MLSLCSLCCFSTDGSIGPSLWGRNTPCYDTTDSRGPLVSTIKPFLGLIASNSFINSHRGHHTESCSMKLHLMPGKLIINKITSVKAITDNNCVKEVLRCVRSGGGHQLNGHSALYPRDGPPQGQRTGADKDTMKTVLQAFFCFVSHGV